MLNNEKNIVDGLVAESLERKQKHLEKMVKEVVDQKIYDCWEWAGFINYSGYGIIGHCESKKRFSTRIHRLIYETIFGKIENGYHLDHLCRKRSCINPFHLEVVTNRENILRGLGQRSINARKTHCNKGHEFKGHNLMIKKTGRDCRICNSIRTKIYDKKIRDKNISKTQA